MDPSMNDEDWIKQIEKKLAMKQRAKDAIERSGAVRRQWTCDDCGSVLSWDSEEARHRHKQSRKHTRKVLPH